MYLSYENVELRLKKLERTKFVDLKEFILVRKEKYTYIHVIYSHHEQLSFIID